MLKLYVKPRHADFQSRYLGTVKVENQQMVMQSANMVNIRAHHSVTCITEGRVAMLRAILEGDKLYKALDALCRSTGLLFIANTGWSPGSQPLPV